MTASVLWSCLLLTYVTLVITPVTPLLHLLLSPVRPISDHSTFLIQKKNYNLIRSSFPIINLYAHGLLSLLSTLLGLLEPASFFLNHRLNSSSPYSAIDALLSLFLFACVFRNKLVNVISLHNFHEYSRSAQFHFILSFIHLIWYHFIASVYSSQLPTRSKQDKVNFIR